MEHWEIRLKHTKNIPFNFKFEQQNQSTFFFLMVSGMRPETHFTTMRSDSKLYEIPSLIHEVLAVDKSLFI